MKKGCWTKQRWRMKDDKEMKWALKSIYGHGGERSQKDAREKSRSRARDKEKKRNKNGTQ